MLFPKCLKTITTPYKGISFLTFVLKYNCFNFANLFFLQVRGVAMGTKMVPNFANLYMAYIEKEYIFKYPTHPCCYRRYIDDIFKLWTSTPRHLKDFESYLNQIHPTVKFTFETLVKQVNYLDVQVHLENSKLHVTPTLSPLLPSLVSTP